MHSIIITTPNLCLRRWPGTWPSYRTGFKAPTLSELFQNFPAFNFFGNPNLKPEESAGYDAGFEQPLVNMEFNRLPPDDHDVTMAYATGSGVSAYGTPTRFKYIVTNRVRDGVARPGLLRTSQLAPGDYLVRIFAEDFAGNRATGPATELAITISL